MLGLPTDKKEIVKYSLDLVEKCQASQSARAAFYRAINVICNTGRDDGKQSLINLLYNHLDRLAANLFSPTELRFDVDFENEYPKDILDRAAVAGRLLTRNWERNNTDMLFSAGVQEALKYGAAVLKQWTQDGGDEPVYCRRLVMPWQFGVYREDENDISQQACLAESTMLSLPQAWRIISLLSATEHEKEAMFRRVASSAKAGQSTDNNESFFHQILSTSILNTTGVAGNSIPGGIVQYGNNATFATLGPEVTVDLVRMHELWIQDETDYTTVQLIEPDIIIAPYGRKMNLLIPGETNSQLQPYTLIQPNFTPGYFWGKSELTDLIAPQGLLSQWADDIKKLFGLQIDKILGFSGYDGLTDELYDQSRTEGYFNMPPNAQVKDLTPTFPDQALPLMKSFMEVFNLIGGTPDIMQGRGEQGVRAGVHADTLLKTASPRMRQSSLIVERQCAAAADLTLYLMQAKDGSKYHTKAASLQDVVKTEFILEDLPDDRRVCVDSHSSSPIFMDDHQQMVAFGLKSGFITKDAAIDMLPLPNKELLHAQLREQEEKQQQTLMQLKKDNPEVYEKLLLKGGGGHH